MTSPASSDSDTAALANDPERTAPVGDLIDLRRRDVLVAFDYRRYQTDTVQSGRAASERGATVVLFTDPWLSPASVYARHTLVTSVEAAAPFDSMVGAVAVIEVSLFTENEVAAVLPNFTPKAPVKDVPAMATWVPPVFGPVMSTLLPTPREMSRGTTPSGSRSGCRPP